MSRYRQIALVVAGGRDNHCDWSGRGVLRALQPIIREVVTGAARGADTVAHEWAQSQGLPTREFPADWSRGLGAGPARNREMALYGDALVAFAGGRGTSDMIRAMSDQGKPVLHLPAIRSLCTTSEFTESLLMAVGFREQFDDRARSIEAYLDTIRRHEHRTCHALLRAESLLQGVLETGGANAWGGCTPGRIEDVLRSVRDARALYGCDDEGKPL